MSNPDERNSLVGCLGDAWNAFFFPAASTARLAALRVVFVAMQLLWFAIPLNAQLHMLDASGFSEAQPITRALLLVMPEALMRNSNVLIGLWALTIGAGVLALIGLYSRYALAAFALGTMTQVSLFYSYGEFHHREGIFCIVLLLMALAPCGDCLSLDAVFGRRSQLDRPWYCGSISRYAMWPLMVGQVLLCIAYFDAAMSKLIVGGPHWFNGYTLQTYLLNDGILWHRPLGVWLSQYRLPCIGLAVGAVGLELLFFVTLIPRARRLTPLFLLSGVAMHVGIYVLQAAPFFQFMTLYLMWVPFERLPVLRDRRSSADLTTQEPDVTSTIVSKAVNVSGLAGTPHH